MLTKILIGALAALVVMAVAWPANAESDVAATPDVSANDDVAFVQTMQELGVTSDVICCDAVCNGGFFGLSRCLICCPPPVSTPKCYCDSDTQEAVCECEVIDNS